MGLASSAETTDRGGSVLALCLLLVGCLALSSGGCLLAVPGQQKRFHHTGRILGSVRTEAPSDHPLVVVIARREGEILTLVDHFVLERPGRFFFTVSPGSYVVSAFEDANRDLRYDPDEAALPADRAPVVEVHHDEVVANVEVVVPPDGRHDTESAIDIRELLARSPQDQADLSFGQLRVRGEVVELSDSRFDQSNATKGLWKPFDFLLDVGAGIYFLEEYDPDKVPVLFVHGSSGTPADFKHLVKHMDRSRFQPWMYYYPSGGYLDRIGGHLVELVSELRVRHDFESMVVVAHSMGGLVARSFLLQQEAVGGDGFIDTFVSISTPWAGAALAERSEHSPIVVYSWEGVAPDSRFLDEIFYSGPPAAREERRLPEGTDHHLIFGFRRNSLLPGVSGDGVITLESQLRPEAQAQARTVIGVNADHTGILRHPATSRHLNAILVSRDD
jgi:pimeloyl-ACP methyl ester carboxylesterase